MVDMISGRDVIATLDDVEDQVLKRGKRVKMVLSDFGWSGSGS